MPDPDIDWSAYDAALDDDTGVDWAAFDAATGGLGSTPDSKSPTGALPALGMEKLETETSGASNLMGYIPSVAIADKAAQLVGAPKGSVTHLASSAAMAAADWLPGLLEEVGKYTGLSGPMIPEEGTIKRLQEEQEKERVSILAQLEGSGPPTGVMAAFSPLGALLGDPQTAYAALSGASEIVGGAAPIGVAGRVGRLLSGTKGKVIGSLAEGAVGFLGSTAGRTAEERVAAIKDPRLLGAVALGVTAESIGARHIAAEAVKAAEEPTAKAVTKSVQKSIESDPTIHAIHEARESAAKVKTETSELTAATEAALSDPIDRLLTESLDTADEAAGKMAERDADIASIAEASLEQAGRIQGERVKYHGSPHQFEKFSLDKIGTGEGAQSYGSGLYFTDKSEIADFYARQQFSNKIGTSPSNEIGSAIRERNPDLYEMVLDSIPASRRGLTDDHSVGNAAKAVLANDWVGPDDLAASIKDAVSDLKPNSGSVYASEILPKDSEWLLLDRPVSDQPQQVIRAIEQSIKALGLSENELVPQDFGALAQALGDRRVSNRVYTGFDILADLEVAVAEHAGSYDAGPAGASALLRKHGVRGNKYLSGESRGRGYGSHNYVLFDDADAEVISRNGREVFADDTIANQRYEEFNRKLRGEKAQDWPALEMVRKPLGDSSEIEARTFRDYDDGPQPRTVEDAAAEYRDAMRAIAPKVEEMAGRKYDSMAKRGKVPQHEGAPLSREQFVERITTERVQKLNGDMAGVLLGIEQNGAGETIRALDTQFDAILKKYKINPEEVGFRGVASRRRESALREGSKWISDQLGERPIHLVEDADLERLAAKAGLEGAPTATFDLLEKERIRRINSEPPEALVPGPMDSPGAIRQRLSTALEVADAEASKGLLDPELRDRGDSLFSRAGYRFSKAMGRIRSEGAYNLKVGRRLFGQSLTDVVAPLADRKFAEQRLGVMRTIREDARGEADVIIRQASVAITDLNREIDSFAAEQVKAGGEFNRSAMEVQIRDAYLDGDLDKLPPQIAQTIRGKVDPVLSQLGDYVYKNTDDEAIKKAIEANRGKYLYRFFNIFADREAIFKKVETQTEAYQRFAKKISLEKVKSGKTRYADISERLHKEHADRLREQGLSEAEVVAAIDDRVQLEIHGLIESMIKKNLYAPGTRGESYRAIGALPAKHYEIERILNDADLREILGEEKHFSIAVMTTVEKIATDIERQAINSRFLSALQDSGLASETPRPGVFERVSKKTLDNVDREVVPESEVLYIHPEANAVLKSVRTAGEIYMQQLNKMTAWIKLNLILTPHNYASQWVGFPHMALLGGGTTGMARLLRRDPISGSRGIFLGPQVAKELIRPGQAARFTSASAEKFYKGLGFADMETVRELSDKLNRYGLDRGNELVFEAELATRPLLEGAKSPQTRAEKSKAAKGLKVATDEFRRPDIAAKVVVYKASLEDMLYKEGVSYDPKSRSYTSSDGVRLPDAEVEALEKESIRRTLMLTQDPRTTPAILRDMSYGVRGLAFAGFHGFIYQMTRAFGNSYKLAMDDAARMTSLGEEALRLERSGDAAGAAKNRAKAKRYGAAAADRALTTTVAAYLVPRMITYGAAALYEKYEELKGKFFGDKEPKGLILDGDPWDRGRSARRFMWDQQQNSNMMAPRVKRVQGRKKVLLIDGGRMDILDNTTKILRAFSQPGDVADKFAAVGKEIQNQYLSLGFYVESLRQFDLPEFDSTPEGLQDFAVGTAKEVGGLAMRFANPLLRGGTKMVSEPDSRMATAFKLSTGAWVQEVDAQEVVGKKYDRDWRGASWVQTMRDEWTAANSFAAQSKVKMHYKRRWDNLMSEFMQNAADARGMADMSPSEIARSLNEARTSKSTGKEYKSPIPTWMHSTIASGRVVPLESYLSRIER